LLAPSTSLSRTGCQSFAKPQLAHLPNRHVGCAVSMQPPQTSA
jgi:hypothetical protein